MPDIIQGSVRADQVNQDRLVISMEKYSTKLDDEAAFFLKLMQLFGGGVESVGRMEHKFRELRLRPLAVTTTAVAAAAATTISVTNPMYFLANDVCYCPATREMFAVTADPSVGDTTITVRKITAAAGTGIVTEIPSGSVILNLQESHSEGGSVPTARAVKSTTESVYIYQFDSKSSHTDIEINEEDYGQRKLEEDREVEMIHQLRALNMMFYTGSNLREVTSASGPRRHLPAGLEYYLFASGVDATGIEGGLTMAALGQIVRPTKAHSASSMVKKAMCGTKAWATISNYPASAVRIEPGEGKTWGVTVSRLITPFGNIDVGYDNVLSDENGMGDRMFIVDPKFVKMIQLRNLPLVMKTNIYGDTDPHNIVDLITGTRGMVLKLTELHKEVYNIGV